MPVEKTAGERRITGWWNSFTQSVFSVPRNISEIRKITFVTLYVQPSSLSENKKMNKSFGFFNQTPRCTLRRVVYGDGAKHRLKVDDNVNFNLFPSCRPLPPFTFYHTDETLHRRKLSSTGSSIEIN